MFKNEADIMKEWITHYINQGVDKLLMIDNDSNDNYLEILSPYIENNKVNLKVDKRKHSQTLCYNENFLEECKQYDWVIVCDLDEFIYARRGFKTIKEYLNKLLPSVSQICIPWKMFGSNGFNTLEQRQPDSVVKTFIKRINYDKQENFQGVVINNNNKYSLNKSIIRTSRLKEFGIHSHIIYDNNSITTQSIYNDMNKNKDAFYNDCNFSIINEKVLENSFLHLNHYAIQSFEWFMRVKTTRGDINNIDVDNIRNENYFKSFDDVSNDIYDVELCNKSILTN
jgi:hypothetical protein